jgi:rubrerythrin
MPRYIDAEKLTDKVFPIGLVDNGKYTINAKAVKVAIDNIPTADVVEVRHGEWQKKYDKAPRYVCSSCDHLFNNKGYSFCPNCGAKMNGERKEK